MNDVKTYLKSLLNDHDTVVLALSGGPDSMCLLHLLEEIPKDIRIVVAHVNHHTRVNNDKEEEFVRNYISNKPLIFEYYKIDSYKNNRFTEKEAREKRYQFLKDVVRKYQAKCLMTAHHGDDLVETVLMRILRGSSLEGYAGIARERIWDDVLFIRPLLTASKEEILCYLKQYNIPYVQDETNESFDYLRNRIRHNILPELKKEGDYTTKFYQFSETILKSSKIIEEDVIALYSSICHQKRLEKHSFLNLNSGYQHEILKYYFKVIYSENLYLLDNRHVEMCLRFIKNGRGSIDLPNRYKLYVSDSWIWAEDTQSISCSKNMLDDEITLPNGDKIVKVNQYEEKSNNEIHLNSKEIVLPLYVVHREKGMKMEVKNLFGHKKINDILINKKIFGSDKDRIPIVVDSNGTVLWIPGLIKSKYDLEKDGNYDIIYKYVKKKGK